MFGASPFHCPHQPKLKKKCQGKFAMRFHLEYGNSVISPTNLPIMLLLDTMSNRLILKQNGPH